jgi:hypothetical protein
VRRSLLVGSAGPERIPSRPDPDDTRWFEPHHVRDATAARSRLAGQVAVGADIVLAPTWLTHRRALLPLGETRRAGEWTAAAVHLAREAVELGLERREEAGRERADGQVALARPAPLVGAVLPALDEDPETGSGRLLPREAATERDYRDQAGLLADARPDLVLLEGQRTHAETRTAAEEAAATELPVWVAATAARSPAGDGDDALARWAEVCRGAGAAVLLAPAGGTAERAVEALSGTGLCWGGLVGSAGAAAPWLEAGASVVALLDGAVDDAVERLRAAIDEIEGPELAARAAAEGRWLTHVARAARMAPGGAALWLGDRPATPLPDGFTWLALDAAEPRELPRGRFRLLVAAGRGHDPEHLAPLLEAGGVMALALEPPLRDAPSLQLLGLDGEDVAVLALYRRDP